MAKKNQYSLLTQNDIPYPMRHPFIETGYRQLHRPWSYYYASVVKWHNETLNVWTHVIAAIIVLYYGIRFHQKHDLIYSSEGNKMLVFIVGGVILTILSSIAHWFGSRSVKSHVIFFLLDYAGIAQYVYTTSLGSLYIFCGEIQTFETLRPFYIAFGVVLATICFVMNCVAKVLIVKKSLSSTKKLLTVAPYLLFGLYTTCPVIPRYWYCYLDNECALYSLKNITMCYVLFLLAAVVYALQLPERLKAKSYDNCGQSHQIFHLCILAAMVAHIYTIDGEIASGHSSQLEFDFGKSVAGFVCLVVSMIMVIIFYLPSINILSKKFASSKSE